MSGTYLLAHDLGTSGNKAAMFDADGRLIGSRTVSYGAHYFNSGWVEQNADDWWNAVCKSTRDLIAESKINPADIAAVSFSGQMLGCLCLDRHGRPLRPSIIWADQRAQEQSSRLHESIADSEYYSRTGHPLTASYSLLKFMWIMENEPDVYRNTWKTVNAKDYVVYRLTGNLMTDYSDAASCGFFNLEKLEWDRDILGLTGLDPAKLPDAVPSTTLAGRVTDEAAGMCGLVSGTPVILGAGDGVAASVGAGSVRPGDGYICLGTSAWVSTTSADPNFDHARRTVTWPHMVPGLYAPNGTMQYAAGSYQWLRSIAGDEDNLPDYEMMNRLVRQSPPGANGVMFMPYLLGERAPLWNPDATGAWLGLKTENTRGDLFRSVIEGVSLNLALIRDALDCDRRIDKFTIIGGAAKGDVWTKTLADVMDAAILVPELVEEAGSMGAAVNAGVGCGVFDDFTAIDKFISISGEHCPDRRNTELYMERKKFLQDYYQALKPMYQAVK